MHDSRKPRLLPWIALIAVLVVTAVYARALLESRAALHEARELAGAEPRQELDELLAAGQRLRAEAAIRSYRHAIEWHAPINPFADEAVEALYLLGEAAAQRPDGEALALNALESLRSAILVTRSIYTPYEDRLLDAEALIAELRAADSVRQRGGDLASETARQLGLLERSRERAPDPGWSLVTTVAFVLWLAATWLALRRAFDREGGFTPRRSLIPGLASAFLLATWIVGLTVV